MYNLKRHWLMILQRRKEYFLYKKEPRDFDEARLIREMQDLIVNNKIKDYSILEDFGLDVELPKCKHKLILT
jgi:hypothetical protein